jgi:tripartite motif-containing protein 71
MLQRRSASYLSRRRVLRAATAAAVTALLTACGESRVPTPTVPPPTFAAPAASATSLPPLPPSTPPNPTPTAVASTTATAAPTPRPTTGAASATQSTASVGSAASGPAGPTLVRLLSIDGGKERLITPSGLSLDANGNLYVGQYPSGGIVKVFAPDGTFLRKWGKQGDGDGELSGVTGINVDAMGSVYVADFQNTRVQVFDSTGTFLRQVRTEPPIGPVGMAFDRAGNFYIANHRTHDHYVQKFSPDGRLLLAWGGNGAGNGEFKAASDTGPTSLVVDGAGNVYVADPVNSRIQKFDNSGKWLASIGGKGDGDDQFPGYSEIGVTVDAAGNLYATERGNIVKFDGQGKFVVRWRGTGSLSGTFSAGGGLRVDGEGNVYIIDKLHNEVVKFSQQ